VPVFYKAGGSVSRLNSDLLACQVDALAKAPVATQVRQGPPRYIPGTRHCNVQGHCIRRGGYFIGGEIYSVDVNARLRRELELLCMERKGYSSVELPRCRSGETPTDTPTSDPRLPPLTERSCVKRDPQGRWQIIDPAG
jgi:hypothetical protein